MSDQHTAAVLAALQALYNDPNAAAKKRANEWLEEFQHSIEAWQTCHTLLTSLDAPPEGRLFAAQTIRSKILYDLAQLPREQLSPLRDSLISSLSPLILPGAPSGSKAVLVQLSLALADLALQMPEWADVVGGMIEQFGKDPGTVSILLRFLKALVEEVGNPRLTVVGDQDSIISAAAEPVIGVLSMYIQAPGIPTSIQSVVFDTLRSWLQGGEVAASQVSQTPLFPALFDALPSDELFDSAVDCLCDLIHETQELEDNIQVIHQVLPRLINLTPQLEQHKDDPDRIRGYCRVLSEAGETYKDLIVRHPSEFLPLVQAIAACAEYPDLDIVPITFGFWYNLATAIGRNREPSDALQPILDIFERLQTVIIGHLHFPRDDEQVTAQERDEFRMFRHRMGDTLKDCCHVLGAATCLRKSYQLVQVALAKQQQATWQEIEAPLFSMRSMGAEVDPNDDEVLPHIMDMLPSLPDHPRIRYAAILVISRYTQWIDRHPQNLAFQLQYISAGFDMAQEDVSAAAAQAMKFMCQDCNRHLIPFLPQLHSFVSTVGDRLDQADMVEVCEAIGYVIKDMPPDQAATALQQFAQPLIQRIQTTASSTTTAEKPELQSVADALELLDAYLGVIGRIESLPTSCHESAAQVYSILDTLLTRYAGVYYISERIGSVVRRGLNFFPLEAVMPVVPALLHRMGEAFRQTGYPSYVWVHARVVVKVAGAEGEMVRGPGGDEVVRVLMGGLECVTAGVSALLGNKIAVEIPDVMDDYIHVLQAYLTHLPIPTSHSSHLPTFLSHILSTLSCPSIETIISSLDTLATLASLLSNPSTTDLIQPVFAQYGKAIIVLLLDGVVQAFPEDVVEQVQVVVGATVTCVQALGRGKEVEGWAGEAMAGLPGNVLPGGEKEVFLRELHDHLEQPGAERLRAAINNLVRAARKARDRGRQTRQSMGGPR